MLEHLADNVVAFCGLGGAARRPHPPVLQPPERPHRPMGRTQRRQRVPPRPHRTRSPLPDHRQHARLRRFHHRPAGRVHAQRHLGHKGHHHRSRDRARTPRRLRDPVSAATSPARWPYPTGCCQPRSPSKSTTSIGPPTSPLSSPSNASTPNPLLCVQWGGAGRTGCAGP